MELHFFCYLPSLQPSFSPSLSSLPTTPTEKRGERKNLRNNTGKAVLRSRGEIVSYHCWLVAQVGWFVLTYCSCVLGLPLSVCRAGVLGPGTLLWLVGIYCSLLQNRMSRSPDERFSGWTDISNGVKMFWIPGLFCLRWHQQIWTKERIFLISSYWAVQKGFCVARFLELLAFSLLNCNSFRTETEFHYASK